MTFAEDELLVTDTGVHYRVIHADSLPHNNYVYVFANGGVLLDRDLLHSKVGHQTFTNMNDDYDDELQYKKLIREHNLSSAVLLSPPDFKTPLTALTHLGDERHVARKY